MPRKAWGRAAPATHDNSYESKRRAALETAARAFNERGFYKTSLDDVAAELNVTKPALYYYFRSKDEILYECHSAAIQSITDGPLDLGDRDASGLEKIEQLVRRYVAMIVQSFGRCLVLVGTQPLERQNAAKCRAGRRGINDLLVRLVREGIDDGSIAPCDPKLAAYFVFGALNWIAHWYDEGGRCSLEEVTERALLFVKGGLSAKQGSRQVAQMARVR